jgi:hypothetical protein
MDTQMIIWFLIGTINTVTLAVLGWVLLTLIKVLQRLASLEGKFDAFPIQQIANNRHRIEQLEKHQELADHKIGLLERGFEKFKDFCGAQHGTDLGKL